MEANFLKMKWHTVFESVASFTLSTPNFVEKSFFKRSDISAKLVI